MTGALMVLPRPERDRAAYAATHRVSEADASPIPGRSALLLRVASG
jgi:hypothetical protein